MQDPVPLGSRSRLQFRLISVFVVMTAVAAGFGWMTWRHRQPYREGYLLGFTYNVQSPGTIIDFGNVSKQVGFDDGAIAFDRLFPDQQSLPEHPQHRYDFVLIRLTKDDSIRSDLRQSLIEELRYLSHQWDDFDVTDLFDQVARIRSYEGFGCHRCGAVSRFDSSAPRDSDSVTFHALGQKTKREGWLVQEAEEGGWDILCPKCRHLGPIQENWSVDSSLP